MLNLTALVISSAAMLSFPENPEWTLFLNPDLSNIELTECREIPRFLGGAEGKKVVFENRVFRIRKDRFNPSDCAVLMQEWESAEDGVATLGCGADYFFRILVNGREEISRLHQGNFPFGDASTENFRFVFPVRKGKNLIVVFLRSGTGGFAVALGRPAPEKELSADELPTLSRYLRIPGDMEKSDSFGMSPGRRRAVELIEAGVETMTQPVFQRFDSDPGMTENELSSLFAKHPVLALYDAALDKILREVPETRVPEGAVVLWHLYNMGYVVKTPKTCFGIDIHHRRAHLLVPLLDFCLTTHNHNDHYNLEFLRGMANAGKPVVSNFYPAAGYSRPPAELTFGDVSIRTAETDHNRTLAKFMTTYEIRCGSGPDACMIFHSGDTGFADQLQPASRPDIWMVHPRVGLSVRTAAARFLPRLTFFSHLWEMEHCPPSPWRPVTATELYESDMPALKNLGLGFTVPVWGEKIVWIPAERK